MDVLSWHSRFLITLRLLKKKINIKDIFILVQVLQTLYPKIQEESGQRHLPSFAFLSRLLVRELTVSRTSVLKCCSGGLMPGPCSCKMWWKTRSASAILESFWGASSAELGKSGKDWEMRIAAEQLPMTTPWPSITAPSFILQYMYRMTFYNDNS